MQKYRFKEQYEALQWDDNINEVEQFLGYMPHRFIDTDADISVAARCLNIPCMGNPAPYCCWPKDFIVRNSSGSIFIEKPNNFRSLYEEVK